MAYAILKKGKLAWWYIAPSRTWAMEQAERDGLAPCAAVDLTATEARLRAYGVSRPWDDAISSARAAAADEGVVLADDDVRWLLTRPVEELAAGVARRGVPPEVIDAYTRTLFSALAKY